MITFFRAGMLSCQHCAQALVHFSRQVEVKCSFLQPKFFLRLTTFLLGMTPELPQVPLLITSVATISTAHAHVFAWGPSPLQEQVF